MASKIKAECSLNTTECILETIASILNEIQEQNNEYNWDPLTFVFTAIIGIIAILVAGLAAFQAFLAAGPGRTKSGAYAIGPWSRQNHRKFDFAEMRFRTTASTPILTIDSLNLAFPEDSSLLSPDPAILRKGEDDYFPATWLAFLSQLSLDHTSLWKEVKITGADFVPSELSAVPAYGSIRFVATLAMILSRGSGRLTIDRETELPRVRDNRFNLVFRQHPLLGIIGFFEMYGKIGFQKSLRHREMYERLIQAYGHMDIPAPERGHGMTRHIIRTGEALTFNEREGQHFMLSLRETLQQECPHCDVLPKPACLNLADCLDIFHANLLMRGPLYLLLAHIPHPHPDVFPHRGIKLCEKLTTLLLQSRFWSMKSAVRSDFSLSPSANEVISKLHIAKTATSWARSEIDPRIDELELWHDVYEQCLMCLDTTLDQGEHGPEFRPLQHNFESAVESIDRWLKKIEPHVLCRKLTLSVVGDGIQQMINTNSNIAVVLFSLDGCMLPTLHGKLGNFLHAIDNTDTSNRLYSGLRGMDTSLEEKLSTVRHDTYEGLRKVQNLWEMEELPLNDDVSESEDKAHRDLEQKSRAWKLPSATVHPLDDVLIYRAVLMTLIYCLSRDNSDLMGEEAYETIVPIM